MHVEDLHAVVHAANGTTPAFAATAAAGLRVDVVFVQQRAHVAALVGREVGPHVVRERHARPRQPLGHVVQRQAALTLAGIEAGQLDALAAAARTDLFGAGDFTAAAAR